MRRKLIAALTLSLTVVTASAVSAQQIGFSAPHSWRIERNKVCLSSHSHLGFGEGKTKRAALKAAARAWRDFTSWEYGPAWASYKRSAGKIVGYTKAAVGWSASIEARPCRTKPRGMKRRRRS